MLVSWGNAKQDAILLLLLGVANSAPILARLLLRDRFSTPVDLGARLWDRRRVFGSHKTIRGIVASLALTPAMGAIFGIHPWTGLKLALYSMLADLGASFLKRRMGLKSGARATGLDQLPEALVPLLLLKDELGIGLLDSLMISILFFVLEVLISPLLYSLRIRRAPY